MLDMNEIETAIAELEANKTTFANCSKLATLYTVRDHMTGDDRAYDAAPYSRAAAPSVPERVNTYGNSEFLKAIDGKELSSIWPIIDELMQNLQIVNERVYYSVIAKINRL